MVAMPTIARNGILTLLLASIRKIPVSTSKLDKNPLLPDLPNSCRSTANNPAKNYSRPEFRES